MVTAMLMYATRHIESTGQTHPMSTDKVTLPLKIPDVPFVWDSEVELSLFEEVPRLDGICNLYLTGRPVLHGQPGPIKDETPNLVHFCVQHKQLRLDSEAQLMFYLYMAWYYRKDDKRPYTMGFLCMGWAAMHSAQADYSSEERKRTGTRSLRTLSTSFTASLIKDITTAIQSAKLASQEPE